MGSRKKQTVGYKYFLGMHMILCHGPIDAVYKIFGDDKEIWAGTTTGGRVVLNKPDLYGGADGEGGISGDIDIEFGGPAQGQNDYLQEQLGSVDIPAFRGVVSVIMRQCYVGTSHYLKYISFLAKRINKTISGGDQWYPAKAAVGTYDMNPVHIIRECLTDPTVGMGYPESDIDDTSFRAAADTLYSEGFGMSLLWDREKKIEDLIMDVLDHIDGVLFVGRSSGRFSLRLARDDYDPDGLLELNESDITSVDDFKRRAPGELVNSVTVEYWDRTTGKDASVTIRDPAIYFGRPLTVGHSVSYPGVTSAELATKLAYRELKALGSPMASATICATRKAATLNIGDVFAFRWEKYGIERMIMRVGQVDLGRLEQGEVRITCTEDVFSLGSAILEPPTESQWVPPTFAPVALAYRYVMEAPYYEVARVAGDAAASALPATAGFVLCTGAKPLSAAVNAQLWTDSGGGYSQYGHVDFCPTCLLSGSLGKTDTSIGITAGIDLSDVEVGGYAILGDEVIRVDGVGASTLTVGRGCLDTVPQTHSGGERIYFADTFADGDYVEYAQHEAVHVRMLTTTPQGVLALSAAPTDTVTMTARLSRPYPPGQFRINGGYYPSSVSGDVTVSWAHRDRLQQTVDVIDHTAGNIGPEAGTTYTVRYYSGATLVKEVTGISGTSNTCVATELAGVTSLRVDLFSVRGGLASHQTHTHTCSYSG